MMTPEPPTLGIARSGGAWHLVNRTAAALCGASTPAGGWQEWDTAQTAISPSTRCPVCLERSAWLSVVCPVPPHADRAAYRRWVQTEWWLAGGLVFPASSARHAQEGRA